MANSYVDYDIPSNQMTDNDVAMYTDMQDRLQYMLNPSMSNSSNINNTMAHKPLLTGGEKND